MRATWRAEARECGGPTPLDMRDLARIVSACPG
jgi:hypothetical protein